MVLAGLYKFKWFKMIINKRSLKQAILDSGKRINFTDTVNASMRTSIYWKGYLKMDSFKRIPTKLQAMI